MNSKQFSGKVAIITGAANGIGLVTAAHFASQGANIVAVDLAEAPLPQLDGVEQRAITVSADVSQVAGWSTIVERAIAEFGRIDILINCAGISGPLGRLEACPVEEFDRVMAINVCGTFLGMQAVTPTMQAQKSGHIVNISSISGTKGNPRVISYTASKHAVNGLTKCAALDLAEDGIRVNAVAPAPIDTAMIKRAEDAMVERLHIEPEAARDTLSSGIPLKRYGQPGEVAAVMAFLCSDSASFMTGAIVPVDGGVLAH